MVLYFQQSNHFITCSCYVRTKLTEVSVSDKLEEFRASKEVMTLLVSLYMMIFYLILSTISSFQVFKWVIGLR